jgi:hypothetical protein
MMLPEDTAVRAANHAMDERMKKEKDEKKVRKQARLDHGKRRQGLEEKQEEEDEEEEGDGHESPIHWDEVGSEDEDLSSQ